MRNNIIYLTCVRKRPNGLGLFQLNDLPACQGNILEGLIAWNHTSVHFLPISVLKK